MENTYTTSVTLKEYIQLIDQAQSQYVDELFYRATRDNIISGSSFDDIRLIITGCRVHVRVMQGIDTDVATNIQIVNQKPDTQNGRDGKRFWQLIGKGLATSVEKDTATQVLKIVLYTIPVVGNIIASFASMIDSQVQQNRQQVLTELKDGLSNYIEVFGRFLTDWKKEDKIQHPEKYPNEPKLKSTTFTAVGNGDATITITGVLDGETILIDGLNAGFSKGNSFTSSAQKDGTHKVEVIGNGLNFYPDTMTVTTKATIFSSPKEFIKNNGQTILIIAIVLILVYAGYKRGLFSRN